MCPDCLTKDYCECFKASLTKYKKDKRDRAVRGVASALHKHKVMFADTGLTNVVSIRTTMGARVLLSLKSTSDTQGYAVYKFRLNSGRKWSELRRNAFFTWLKSQVTATGTVHQPVGECMPFGKYRGVPLREIVAHDRSYLQWVLATVTTLPAQFRQALTELLP